MKVTRHAIRIVAVITISSFFFLAAGFLISQRVYAAYVYPQHNDPPPEIPEELYGTHEQGFPSGVNPLTGQPVVDIEQLNHPAVLVSVSDFPGATRPQTGLSFADQVYEFWIGVGMTRFLPVYYGHYPELQPSMVGDCPVRWTVFDGKEPVLGNLIWFDQNRDGIRQTGERGVPGVCVELYDAQTNLLLENTSSDSNGYYGFSVPADRPVFVHFLLPMGSTFAPNQQNLVNIETGSSQVFSLGGNDFSLNPGLMWIDEKAGTSRIGDGGIKIQSGVWTDDNHDGIRDPGEKGLANIQVNLYDGASDTLLAVTRTDKEGMYEFDIQPGKEFYLQLLPDVGGFFTRPDDEKPVDIAINDYEDPLSGFSPLFTPETFLENPWGWGVKKPQSGPLRSGRIVFQTMARYYNGAQLFYASKHESVPIGGSGNVYEEDPTSISTAFLDVERMLDASASSTATDLNYTSNDYMDEPPSGGNSGETLTYFGNVLNVAQYRYDPLSRTYLRYDDHNDGRGSLYPSVDRITGRQLHYSNVIVVFVEHKQIQGLMIDMKIKPGDKNKAYLFRDGQIFPIVWSAVNEDYEKTTQRLRPPRILDKDGKPFPLKPGSTWTIFVTERSLMIDEGNGLWRVRFFEPPIVGDFRK